MSVIGSNILAGASGQAGAAPAGYAIERSLRFNRSDSAYLNRTPSTAGNRRTWTWSGWVKLNKVPSGQSAFFNAKTGSGNANTGIDYDSSGSIRFIIWNGSGTDANLTSSQVFRDFSAWYHLVVAFDSTQATASDRVKMYINGSQITDFSTSQYPSQNYEAAVNLAQDHYIGRNAGNGVAYLDSYLADVHFIDNQALAPTDFGEYDDNNVWQPKEFTGSYVSDTFYSSYATNPSSFNGSAHNLFDGDLTTSWQNTDTSGSTYASVDLTQGGAVSGIAFTTSFEMYGAFSYNQVLEIDHAGGTHTYNGNPGGSGAWINFASSLTSPVTAIRFKDSGGTGTPSWNAIRVDNTILTEFGANSFHLDFSDNSSNAALGTDSSGNNNDWTVNNITANAPGLATAKQGMDVVTYTGNGTSQTISGLQFQPDFVWIKPRNVADHHILYDSVRGVRKQIYTTLTNAEETETQGLSAFTSNGFTVNGTHTVRGQTNDSGSTYVGWCWKAGGTGSTDSSGTITVDPTVSANTTYGFSIVKFTRTASEGVVTVPHGLGSAPKLIIHKRTSAAQQWFVYHESLGNTQKLILNSTAAASSGYWDNTSPSSTVFTLDSDVNLGTGDFIAYCWSEVAGFSKFGSYTGTGAVGHKITTGFKPAYILFKRTDSLSNWRIVDEKRGTSSLNAETSEGEQTLNFAINADGFTINETGNNPNASGGTYIYAAFAGTPAGEDVDSLFDSPQNGIQTDTGAGGEVSGNYATLNPLTLTLGAGSSGTLSNGNLEWLGTGNNDNVAATFAASSGKFYYEVQPTANVNNLVAGWTTTEAVTHTTVTALFYYESAGIRAGTKTSVWNTDVTTGLSFANNDILGFAIDIDGGELKVYQNNVLKSTITLPTDKGDTWIPCLGDASATDASAIVNFGQRAFAYTAPSGFKALNTANLADPTIADGSDYMDVVTRAGGGVNQSFTTLSPGLVWEKRRDSASSHYLFDVNRGNDKYLSSNTTAAEGSQSGAFTFNANSYVVSSGFDWPSSASVVDWVWDAGHPATAATGAVSFDGTGDYLSGFGGSALLPTSTGTAFVVDCFWSSSGNTTQKGIWEQHSGGSGRTGLFVNNGTATFISEGNTVGSFTYADNRWYFTRIIYDGSGNIYHYVDGVLIGSGTQTVGVDNTGFQIGAYNTDSFNGHISNFRIVVGSNSLSGTDVPTSPLTNITNTTLLCCQSTTSATAAAVTPGTITANGDASATTFNPLDKFSVNGTGYATTSAAGITEGSIPLTGASVNRSAGFSIVSYTAPSSGAFTVGHGLNAAPEFIITKSRSNAYVWGTYHIGIGNTGRMDLNSTAGITTTQNSAWNNTSPTSTVFSMGSDWTGSSITYVAYCFAPVEGYSAFGSYTGNGSTDGPFVYTGMRPRWLMFKRSDTANSWMIYDAARNKYNVIDNLLKADSSNAETSVSGSDLLDFTSNGFKIREDNAGMNASGGTYVYACFAENPFKYARAR